MIPTKLRSALAALLGATLLAGCAADYEGLLDLDDTPGSNLMARYVSLGNSLTAGLQSGGLTDSLQMLAYPVLVAAQAQAPFVVPLLADPGCPPPLTTTILVPNPPRVGNLPGNVCALRDERVLQTRPIQNVAYPGSYIAGAIDPKVNANPPSANVYKTLLLGGRSQVDAMADANPSFVSVWLGNNETLFAVTDSLASPDLLVPLPQFEAALDSIVRAIEGTNAEGAALISPFNALAFAPRVQPGAFYFLARQFNQIPKAVGASCAPGTPGGRSSVALDVLTDPKYDVIECNETSPYVMSQNEATIYRTRVNAYKAAVRARANANKWIYIDPDARFANELADPGNNRRCQGLATITRTSTVAEIQAAIASTCPSTTAPFFGRWFSFDATHPSTVAHRAFANELITQINQEHDLSIPTLTN